ncbi:MAG: hypothetical protein C7B44_00025 [Sulfobacillus thermosulfidooxidans]|uniref:Uncharacterized protein n=1 Tax=Sulfobacillus thermotolerans TaxID=338644 RepID=A0ABM6RNU2_9FIRM|nr:hypothetical protein [Sulfobacillus sp. hq2]AUW93044.1 hypothetical protein BXT84_02995 [Sulfobacillus thermotolerans]MCY0909648.1 hypothetical protein [Sulfobacillus thermotolerans]POB11090.1 hypothetical protein CO251_05975 [Sulfobacillus sp. hq2]PSR38120.1 MAG: hypothetical protein C7B44_00025 [Sulfobacillus thermosulfidooxidans]
MKWVKKVYGLFVEDPLLAVLGLGSLLIAFILSHVGLAQLSGLVLFIFIAASIFISLRRS